MPELPEVETLKRELSRVLPKKKITTAQVLWPKTVMPLSVAEFEKQIKNLVVKDIERQAKILIINFTPPSLKASAGQSRPSPRRSGTKSGLAFHLKMTGQLIYHPAERNTFPPPSGKVLRSADKEKEIVGGHPAPRDEKILPNKHTRLIIYFTDGAILFFNDLRKFGWARLVNDSQLKNLTEHIGVEPLSKLFTADFLIELFKKYPRRTVKQILMDQSLIAGIGNIYADESAFLAKLLPTRKAGTIKPAQIKTLCEKIVAILKLSIKLKGTSSRNYRRSDGSRGGFVPHLFVYGRAGELCKICGTAIKKIRHNQRGTHFCPKCQK